MKAFVTGGSGFIGRHLIRQLVDKGYEVHALARSAESMAMVRSLGALPVPGDIHDVESMRPAMQGSDVLFHAAAWFKFGGPDGINAEVTNVSGTRKVLRLAHDLGIPKIIYVSSIAVFGNTKGHLADENYFNAGPFPTEYERTKWLAHYKVAIPLIEKGAPIIIAMPGGVYGPGDTNIIAQQMRLFFRGLPLIPAPETTLTFAHVDDVAAGLILLAEKGRIGESYILAGPAVPLGELVEFWAYLTGKPAPALRVPAGILKSLSPLFGVLQPALNLPSVFAQETVSALGGTFIASSQKARTELGWQTRPLQNGMLETFAWIAETEAQRSIELQPEREKQAAGLALIAALLLFLFWLRGRKTA